MFFLNINSVQSIETKIVHNIQNEIITNIDIKNEFKYLLILNSNLKELEKEKIYNISNESAIKEKIKKIELLKNFKKLEINDKFLDVLLKNTYMKMGIKSLNEFEKYLESYDLTLAYFKRKIIIDALWNELIINKYKSQVTINENEIKKKILENKKKKSREYELSEIIFEITDKEEIKIKYTEIVKSINKIGFKNSASLYSFSDSAKTGGDIGWINENSIDGKIKENINVLKIGGISKPIILSNGVLILKVTDIKDTKVEIDFETELKKVINYERNRQLNQYSKIYYNKIRRNSEFYE
tara:strand:+ start:54 stop:947 length:894 start_codon:yes stop_codon:yes gene_type:complete